MVGMRGIFLAGLVLGASHFSIVSASENSRQMAFAFSTLSRFSSLRQVLQSYAGQTSGEDREQILGLLKSSKASLDAPLVISWDRQKMRLRGLDEDVIWHSQGPMMEYQGRLIRPLRKGASFLANFENVASSLGLLKRPRGETASQRSPLPFLWSQFVASSWAASKPLSFGDLVEGASFEKVLGMTSALVYVQKYTDKNDPYFLDIEKDELARLRDGLEKMGKLNDISCKSTGTSREVKIIFGDGQLMTVSSQGQGSSAKRSISFEDPESGKMKKLDEGKTKLYAGILDDLCSQSPEKVKEYTSNLKNSWYDHRLQKGAFGRD